MEQNVYKPKHTIFGQLFQSHTFLRLRINPLIYCSLAEANLLSWKTYSLDEIFTLSTSLSFAHCLVIIIIMQHVVIPNYLHFLLQYISLVSPIHSFWYHSLLLTKYSSRSFVVLLVFIYGSDCCQIICLWSCCHCQTSEVGLIMDQIDG